MHNLKPDEVKKQVINLLPYRKSGNTVYVGYARGKEARDLLAIDGLDKELVNVEFLIPLDTVAFNASFFLGLLRPSIEKLGIEAFQNKYSFAFEGIAPQSIIAQLVEGKRQAQDWLINKSLL